MSSGSKFAGLDFEGFKALAVDPALSRHEKVAFPDAYRAGKEAAILRDLSGKLEQLRLRRQTIVDIGSGCGDLTLALIDVCRRREHRLLLIDSAEMLDQLPEQAHVEKVAGRFPEECGDLISGMAGKVNAVLAYSILQYVFVERSVFAFVDHALELLAPGGRMLVGDIPNRSMRNRFLASAQGARFHRQLTGSDEPPPVTHHVLEPDLIDDAVVVALLQHARAAGFHAFVVPQRGDLPMANRREDLLFVRP